MKLELEYCHRRAYNNYGIQNKENETESYLSMHTCMQTDYTCVCLCMYMCVYTDRQTHNATLAWRQMDRSYLPNKLGLDINLGGDTIQLITRTNLYFLKLRWVLGEMWVNWHHISRFSCDIEMPYTDWYRRLLSGRPGPSISMKEFSGIKENANIWINKKKIEKMMCFLGAQ